MSRSQAVAVLAGLFAVVGVGLGAVGAATTGWAETAFATEAAGDASTFGPVFVAQLYLVTSAVIVMAGPALAAPLGTVFGARVRSTADGVVVGAFGCGLGVLVMSAVGVAIVVASQGAAAEQAHGFAAVAEPAVVGGVASGVVGGVAGGVGAAAG